MRRLTSFLKGKAICFDSACTVGRSEYFGFDEPMTGTDVMAREKMMHFIKALADRGQHTMIYVTHHLMRFLPSF